MYILFWRSPVEAEGWKLYSNFNDLSTDLEGLKLKGYVVTYVETKVL